mmetsp:Transcript_38619/g.95031  ORF Transcript_38619/g.95031 Transcript_38619/m.95031 type:complete len:963 (-) Transcript_38619:680-3568(-)|eukprot:CAMPEP_0206220074 /NCGR_PEP_ID=MMETSP0047_2-20121206/4684_1 /ASSEMBLY_ACC=CAM_ASM_000192 /TAXON_ID=195065 /ORGANISM="Chroomonas mesostigmatica_cf, Strain CCMP1168" /LENGTH=962 /DNA_ID=CAMNT_0053642711 /DNA_START=66 /DNA_END=2954 /DNA_ORIENTATION=+
MSVFNERELRKLLAEAEGPVTLKDREGSDDYAFLEETVLPTLLPALVKLLERLEETGMPAPPADGSEGGGFNSIRWLAEQLVRNHPSGGVFQHDSAYAGLLKEVGSQRKEERVERERKVAEAKKDAENARIQAEREKAEQVVKEKTEREHARRQAAEAKELEKNRLGEEAAIKAIGEDHAEMILGFRNECMAKISAVDFKNESDTAPINGILYKMACEMIVKHTPASFSAVADLHGEEEEQVLYYHTAADKKEAPIEEEEEEEPDDDPLGDGGAKFEKPPKEIPPPEITTRELPSLESDEAYVLKRGAGISWAAVDDRKTVMITDTKYTEGMVFFDGEKRQGTYAAVHYKKEGKVAGLLVGDTLDSMTGKELILSDTQLIQAIAVVLGECVDFTSWSLINARRAVHTEKLLALAAEPSVLPNDIAEAAVQGIISIVPERIISVGVLDMPSTLRLLVSTDPAGNTTRDVAVTSNDTSEHVSLMFEACSKKSTAMVRSDFGHTLSMAVPVFDETEEGEKRVSAVVYIGMNHAGKAINEDVQDFCTSAAQIVAPVLLAPAKRAMRVLSIFAHTGIGDSAPLLDAAATLCERHTGAPSVMVALMHGETELRVVKTQGAPIMSKAVFGRGDLSLCFEAVEKSECVSDGGHTCVPLVTTTGGRTKPIGVICLQVGSVGEEMQEALEGVARALVASLAECDFRRKMTTCGVTALESLLKQSVFIKGGYLAFFDLSGRQVCFQIKAEGGVKMPAGILPGTLVPESEELVKAQVCVGGDGNVCGIVGTHQEMMAEVRISMYDDLPEAIMRDVAATLGHVAALLNEEGLLVDQTSQAYQDSQNRLATHFNASRFDLVMSEVMNSVDLPYISSIKDQAKPNPIIRSILQAIMYMLGHQQLDVSEWSKCRKLITHHIFKEMKMIDVRGQLKVHKLKLAQACIENLTAGDIAMEVGPKALMLWKWVRMMLAVQGL